MYLHSCFSSQDNLGFFQYKKGQVILNLHKAEESSWAVQLSKRGLEQAED